MSDTNVIDLIARAAGAGLPKPRHFGDLGECIRDRLLGGQAMDPLGDAPLELRRWSYTMSGVAFTFIDPRDGQEYALVLTTPERAKAIAMLTDEGA